ncbi:hypothetical protein ACRRTK_017320 [Alexandromys fortis]
MLFKLHLFERGIHVPWCACGGQRTTTGFGALLLPAGSLEGTWSSGLEAVPFLLYHPASPKGVAEAALELMISSLCLLSFTTANVLFCCWFPYRMFLCRSGHLELTLQTRMASSSEILLPLPP